MRTHPRRAHHPVLCIVPPHLLERLARSADPELRALAEAALQALLASERLRGRREGLGAIASLAATPAGEKRRTIFDAEHHERLPGSLVRG